MERFKKFVESGLLRLVLATSIMAGLAVATVSVAAAQTLPEPTATPVPPPVPASSTWALLLLGGALAIALVWGIWRRRQARQNG